jgi:hypothetical protein
MICFFVVRPQGKERHRLPLRPTRKKVLSFAQNSSATWDSPRTGAAVPETGWGLTRGWVWVGGRRRRLAEITNTTLLIGVWPNPPTRCSFDRLPRQECRGEERDASIPQRLVVLCSGKQSARSVERGEDNGTRPRAQETLERARKNIGSRV